MLELLGLICGVILCGWIIRAANNKLEIHKSEKEIYVEEECKRH
jgi:hypothetical protein